MPTPEEDYKRLEELANALTDLYLAKTAALTTVVHNFGNAAAALRNVVDEKTADYISIAVEYVFGTLLGMIIIGTSKLSLIFTNWVYPEGNPVATIITVSEVVTVAGISLYLFINLGQDFYGKIVLKGQQMKPKND